jgi:hypothetical protein
MKFRKLLPAVILAAGVAACGVSSASAAEPTSTRVVLFDGSSTIENGPAVQSRDWTPYDKPESITITNDGTLEEDASLPVRCIVGSPCNEWWYSTNTVQLIELYWDKDGQRVPNTTALSVPLNDSSAWKYLGDGTYTPLCLVWGTADGLHYIKLDIDTHKWSEVSSC